MKFHRNSIDLSTRLFLGLMIYTKNLAHGEVTRLSLDYQVSRWFLYITCRGLVEEFIQWYQQQTPISVAIPLCQNREEKVCSLYLEGESSLEGIQGSLLDLEGIKVSTSWIGNVLNETGSRLPSFSPLPSNLVDGEKSGHPVLVALDEIFELGSPILAVVDPQSLWTYTLILKDQCDSIAWEEVRQNIWPVEGIEDLWGFSDGAKAIRHTVEQGCDGQWALDPWHAFKPLRQIQRSLCKELKTLEEKIAKMEKELERSQTIEQSEQNQNDLWNLLLTQEKKQAVLEQWEILLRWAREALWWIDTRQGTFRSRLQAEEGIQIVMAFMGKLELGGMLKKVDAFAGNLDNLLHYFELIPPIEERLKQLIPDDNERSAILEAYHAYHFSFQVQGNRLRQLKQDYQFWQTALQSQWGEEVWKNRWQQVLLLLSGVTRASSYVENVNSRLRRFLDSARGQVNQNRLNLIRFFLNHKLYHRGKRQEYSSASLKEDTSPIHWLENLREAIKEDSPTSQQKLTA